MEILGYNEDPETRQDATELEQGYIHFPRNERGEFCKCDDSLQSRSILERDQWIVFRNDVVPPSWTLIVPESWDESKSDFKGEVNFSLLFKMAATINVPPSFR